MSRKSDLKKSRIKFNLKRYVFSGRYFVRNALIVMILLTVVAIGAVGFGLLSSMKEDGKQVIEEETPDDIHGDSVPDSVQDSQEDSKKTVSSLKPETPSMIMDISDASMEELKTIIEEEQTVDLTARNVSLLAGTRTDNYRGFLCIEDAVNVRAAADVNSEVVGKLYKGATGEVDQENDHAADSAWTKITSGDVTGYVATTYLVLGEAASLREDETIGMIGTTTGQNVCIRTAGSTDADLVYIAPLGTRMRIDQAEDADGWYHVQLADGTFGYVSSDYVSVEETGITAISADEIRAVTDWKEEQIRKEEEKKEEAMKADLYLLAAITYCEAGVEPYEGQLAVANVVLNRLHSGRYGSTLEDVIYAPYQFTGCKLSSFSWALQTGGSDSCLQAAREALEGKNNIGDCMFFRATWVADLDAIGDYTIIGTHVFY